jgi:NAD+ kinase
VGKTYMFEKKLALLASPTDDAQDASKALRAQYDFVDPEQADIIVVLGGDGHMLHVLHQFSDQHIPVFGMNCGTVGFLMNDFQATGLHERLARAEKFILNPLRMEATTTDGRKTTALAINEVSLLRETRQAAKIEITIDGKIRMPTLIADGVLVATPAGSTAYNLSADGPILPLGSNLLALTPISAYRPRRWPGALLPASAAITFKILEAAKRPVSAVADQLEVRDVASVSIITDHSIGLQLLSDPGHTLAERILNEQFET